jgi:hypothetical protein
MHVCLRTLGALGLAAALFAGAAGASTLSVTVAANNGSCQQGFNDGVTADGTCSTNGAGTFDDWGAQWAASGGTSPDVAGIGSTSIGFRIDAAVAADDGGVDVGQGGDRWIRANVSYTLAVAIDMDNNGAAWNVDLAQSVLGLFALRGDGTLTAVGTQNNGAARISAFTVFVNGSPVGFGVSPTNLTANPSNNASSTLQFSGGRNDSAILSGLGDANFVATVSFSLEALSRDGCSGFLCSSASGGEEAAVLFGLQNVIDQGVDDYSTWGRAIGPDGYTTTWTLNVTTIPEPATLALLGLGLLALGAGGRGRTGA